MTDIRGLLDQAAEANAAQDHARTLSLAGQILADDARHPLAHGFCALASLSQAIEDARGRFAGAPAAMAAPADGSDDAVTLEQQLVLARQVWSRLSALSEACIRSLDHALTGEPALHHVLTRARTARWLDNWRETVDATLAAAVGALRRLDPVEGTATADMAAGLRERIAAMLDRLDSPPDDLPPPDDRLEQLFAPPGSALAATPALADAAVSDDERTVPTGAGSVNRVVTVHDSFGDSSPIQPMPPARSLAASADDIDPTVRPLRSRMRSDTGSVSPSSGGMRRSALLIRLATQLGVLERGTGPTLIGRYRREADGRPFEDWARHVSAIPGARLGQLMDAWQETGLRCKGCGSDLAGDEMANELMSCPVCGHPEFELLGSDASASGRTPSTSASGSVSLASLGGTPLRSGVTPPAGVGPGSDEVADLRRPLQPGDVIGNAEVQGRAGEGGMGTVYRARHRGLGRLVAIKVITPDRLANKDALERFRREARTLAAFDHPHIVQVYDYGEIGGGAYLTMQWVDGQSLADLIREQGCLPAEQALPIFINIAGALSAAHDADVIHRDLKPDNILLGRDGQVKLADFGLAKATLTPDDKSLTRPEVVLGTPLYMAPEQVEGQTGPPADIYALGCSLYHALVGDPPFQSKALWNLLRMHADTEFPTLTDRVPDAPPSLDLFLKRMCAKRPIARPRNAAEVVRGLERVLAETVSGSEAGGLALPLPLARVRRDYRTRRDTPLALYAATHLFGQLIQTAATVAAAPLLMGGSASPQVARCFAGLTRPARWSGWVMAMRQLLRLHEQQKTQNDAIAGLQLFTRTRRNGPALRALVQHLDQVADSFPALAGRLRETSTPVGFAGWALPVAILLDASEAAGVNTPLGQETARMLGAAVEELLDEEPPLPPLDVVWFELTEDLSDGRVRAAIQPLTGEHPAPARQVDLAPHAPELQALTEDRDQGLFLRTQGQLMPMEPLAAFDDGEWYFVAALDTVADGKSHGAEYRCATTAHRMALPADSVFPALYELFPEGLPVLPPPLVSASVADLRADLARFPGELPGWLGQAARLVKTRPEESVQYSLKAAGWCLGQVLGQATPIASAIELLRNASPPLVPTLVESLAGLAHRTPSLGADGAGMALFAAVRLSCWVSGTAGLLLAYNPTECVQILGGEDPASVEGFQPTLKRGSRKATDTPGGDGGEDTLQGLQTLGRRGTRRVADAAAGGVGSDAAVRLTALGPVLPIGPLEAPLPAVFGRSQSATVHIQSGYVSRHHADVARTNDGRLVIVHDAPTNGSAVNGLKLTTGDQHPLRPGDLFFLDTEVFRVEG